MQVSTVPFEAASWELIKGRTALILIDLQNDFLSPEGWYAKSGVDISHMRKVIEPTQRLIAAAREADVPVIWTLHGSRDETMGRFANLRPFLKEGGLRVGTWGFEASDEVDLREEDYIVHKQRLSGFYCTDLEVVLNAIDAQSLLISGVLTNQCVAATSKDASFRDYHPIVVEECTGTTIPHLHEPALEMMRVGWAEVRGVDASIEALKALA